MWMGGEEEESATAELGIGLGLAGEELKVGRRVGDGLAKI